MIPRKLQESNRRLLAEENGAIYKSHTGKLTFALSFPNTYWVGMSALGFQLVYCILNSIPDVVCERVFLPEEEDMRLIRRAGTRLFTLESQTPINQCDALAFSIAFEMDYINVLQIMSLSGIPLQSAERDESHPLIIAGGPAASFNPEPMADFIDLFLIGEAEDAVPEMVNVMRSSGSGSRHDLLMALAQIEGVYVPRFYTPRYCHDGTIQGIDVASGAPASIVRRRVRDVDAHGASSVILTPNTEFAGMTLTEVIRGCGRKCRFCAAGYTDLPPRARQVDIRQDAARVGLVGSAVFDHPEALAICESLTAQGRQFSVSSVRVESLTRDLARMMRQGGQETITLAPEAGTERLRNVINKPISDADIMEAIEIASSSGFRRVKLYFMLGLPTETEDDVKAIPELAFRVTDEFPSLKVQMSVSCYVPKPWTPFQWLAMAKERELSARLALVRAAVAGDRRLSLSTESPRMSIIQGWLARGDRRLSSALLNALNSDNYARGISSAGLDPAFYAHRERCREEVFPWDHINMGVTKDFLWREREKACEGTTTPPCDMPLCKRCGVC